MTARTRGAAPRIAIVGRPNVGKSTLFNRILRRRVAITDDMPGVTRDTVERTGRIGELDVLVIDTGGIGAGETELTRAVMERSRAAYRSADVILLVVDQAERTGEDEELAEDVRRSGRPAVLVVNKIDTEARRDAVVEFYGMGFPLLVAVSAAHGLGMDDLADAVTAALASRGPAVADDTVAPDDDDLDAEPPSEIRLAIVGRPNTGKSSLLNRLARSERSIVSELAGTTRDPVEARFEADGTTFIVTDTAGIRRRNRIDESVEYYAVTRAFDAIDTSDVAILLIDATEGLGEQDKKIAARIEERGCGVVLALNKWDLLPDHGNQLNALTDRIRFLFPVFAHVPVLAVSAHTGYGVDLLLSRLVQVRAELFRRVDTGPLNQHLKRWLDQTPPPSGKRPIKVRYMTQVGVNPVRFIAFVNRTRGFPEFYRRYLVNRIREDLGFHHVPIRLDLRS